VSSRAATTSKERRTNGLTEIVSITDVKRLKQFSRSKFCVFKYKQNPFQYLINWWGDWWGIRVDRADFCPNLFHTIGRIVNGCNKLFVRESVQQVRQRYVKVSTLGLQNRHTLTEVYRQLLVVLVQLLESANH